MAEIGLSILKSQCLDRRIADLKTMREEVEAWLKERMANPKPVKWHFTTEDAQVKLVSLYPKI